MRLLCRPLLYRWFLRKAGKIKSSKSFSFPKSLQERKKTVFFMPEDKDIASVILNELPIDSFKTILFVAHSDLEPLLEKKKVIATYYTAKGCRYGESQFEKIEYQIKTFTPLACVYFGPFKPQFLYLALTSGAALRVGFDCAREYPFLNVSLHTLKTISPAKMMARYFSKDNGE